LDFDEGGRLSDRDRASIVHMATALLADIEARLRAAMAQELEERDEAEEALAASLGAAHVPITRPILGREALARPPGFGALLLHRALLHRLTGPSEEGIAARLVGDGDDEVAAAAMALLVAETRRYDGFREPVLPLADLPAELLHPLAWRTAAALGLYSVREGAGAETAFTLAERGAHRLFLLHDEGESLDARAMKLARLLDARGRLDDGLLAAAAGEGLPALALAGLAHRTRLEAGAVALLLADPELLLLPALLREAGIGRRAAAELALLLAGGEERAERLLGEYDASGGEAGAAELALFRRHPVLREAALDVGAGVGDAR
ncbi:MAG: DUF2336 domain-containing protein, partial [Sphingomonadaceae bacterium]